jgi:hypothetical protein
MRINIDGGFLAAEKQESGKIAISVGCEQFNSDGTRSQTLVNTASLTEEQLIKLFSDVFPEEPVENEKNQDS